MKKITYCFVKFWKIIVVILTIISVIILGFWLYENIWSLRVFSAQKIYFKYPKNWQIYTDKNIDLNRHLPGTNTVTLTKNGRQSTNFGVNIKEVEGNRLNVSDSVKNMDIKNKSLLTDFNKIDFREVTILGQTAIDYTFNYALEIAGPSGITGKWQGRQRQIIFIQNNKLYTLIFTADPQYFDRDSKDFQKILDSFELR